MSGSTTNTEDCMYDVSNTSPQIGIRGYNTYYNDPWATMEHLANDGPVAVSVDAGPWHSYSSGVFDGCSYDQNIGLNHVVQMVGYGTDPTEGKNQKDELIGSGQMNYQPSFGLVVKKLKAKLN